MSELLSIAFKFEEKTYYTLIRIDYTADEKEYHVKVMNNRMERLLYGNHIIREVNGVIDRSTNTQQFNERQLALKKAVTDALETYLSNRNGQPKFVNI